MGPSLDTGIEARKRVLPRHGTGCVLDDPAGGPSCGTTHAPLQRARLSVRGLTANECDRDMPHSRIGRGGMPMAFTGLDAYDVTHIDLTLFMLRCHLAGARRHNQHLVAVMRVPSRSATLAEVHHAAVIVRGIAGLKIVCRDRETGPAYPS